MPRKKSLKKPSARRSKKGDSSWFGRMASEARRSGFGFTLIKLPPGKKR